MSNATKAELLTRIEHSLACDRPFGDHRYINGRTWLHYDCRLEMVAEYLPIASATLAALRKATPQCRYRVLGDPVVRSTINTALAHFKLGGPDISVDETAVVLTIAARHLSEDRRNGPLADGAPHTTRLGRASYHGWVWTEAREDDIPAKVFRCLFHEHLSAWLGLKTPDEHARRMLVKGARLLGELLPKLGRSALSHAHLVAIVTSPLGVTSVTNPSIPGSVFFSPFVLKHPWRAAEFLLHEALHLRFIDLEQTHSLLRRGYSVEESPRIPAIWNRAQPDDSNAWPANRVLTVLHVYTSLALFFKTVELRAPELEERYGPLDDLNPGLAASRALDRARYLALNVKEVDGELGVAGQRFVGWLSELLDSLDTRPRPVHPNARLLLDLYERETEQIMKAIVGTSPVALRSNANHLPGGQQPTISNFQSASLLQIIADLIENEVAGTDRLLCDMYGGGVPPFTGIDGGQGALSTVMERGSLAEIAAQFCSVRSAISQSLRKAVAQSHEPVVKAERLIRLEQHVGAMVERSAEHIKALKAFDGQIPGVVRR